MHADALAVDLARKHRPQPVSAEDQARWEEEDLRHRIMTGRWRADAADEVRAFFHPEVAKNMRADRPDITLNPLRLYAQETAVLYLEPPLVSLEGEHDELTEALPVGHWAHMDEINRNVNALNDVLLRIDWIDDKPKSRMVLPNFVTAIADPKDPTQPIAVRELRWRDLDDESLWTWETWDRRDPDKPIFKIEAVDEKGVVTDITDRAWDGPEGAYPYTDDDGAIPVYTSYHKRIQAGLWNPYEGRELVTGTLRTAAYRTFWGHGFRNASWPKNYGIDVEVIGTKNDGGIRRIIEDPTTYTMFRRTNAGGGIGQLTSHLDPMTGMQALMAYVASLATFAGLSASDVTVESRSPSSGASLTVQRESLRRVQRRQAAPFRASDQLSLSAMARMSNAFGSTNLPTEPSDYSIGYIPIGQTPAELTASIARVDAMIERGVAGPVQVLRTFRPELSADAAIRELVGQRKQQIELDVAIAEVNVEAGVTADADGAAAQQVTAALQEIEVMEARDDLSDDVGALLATLRAKLTDAGKASDDKPSNGASS